MNCPCGKKCFSAAAAHRALSRAIKVRRAVHSTCAKVARMARRRCERRAYRCPICPWWHLSSQPYDGIGRGAN